MLKAGTAARRQTLHGDGPLAADEVRQGIQEFLRALDAALQQRDPNWVGHAKLLLAQGEATFYASITAAGDQPRWAGTPIDVEHAEATIYVAIYAMNDTEVAAALDATLATTLILPFRGVTAG